MYCDGYCVDVYCVAGYCVAVYSVAVYSVAVYSVAVLILLHSYSIDMSICYCIDMKSL